MGGLDLAKVKAWMRDLWKPDDEPEDDRKWLDWSAALPDARRLCRRCRRPFGEHDHRLEGANMNIVVMCPDGESIFSKSPAPS